MTKELEMKIFERDEFTCKGCHKKFPHKYEIKPEQRIDGKTNYLLVDHIEGRQENLDNLQTLCWKCNSSKSGRAQHSFRLSQALKTLGHCVVYYPSLAKLIGLKESIFLCQLIYWTPKGRAQKGDGWIYKSVEEMEEETGLSYKEQIRLRKSLVEQGLLEEMYDRENHVMFFRVIADALDAKGEHITDGHMLESNQPDDQKEGGILPKVSSYNEQEITQENTTIKTTPSLNDFSLTPETNGHPKKHTRGLEKTCDPRCKAVTAKIFEAYKYHNKVNPPWGAAEGKQLKNFLASHSDWSEEKIFECIRNRSKSEVNLAQEPLGWISKLGNYAGGPLDKFGNPKSNGNGFHNGHQSRTNGSGATGHLLDHLPDADEIERRRKADDKRLEERRNARGM